MNYQLWLVVHSLSRCPLGPKIDVISLPPGWWGLSQFPREVCDLDQHLSIPWAPTRLLLPKGQPTGIRVHSPSPPGGTHCLSQHLQERAQSQPCLWLMQSLWLFDSNSNKFYLLGGIEIKKISFIGLHFCLFALVSLILCLTHTGCAVSAQYSFHRCQVCCYPKSSWTTENFKPSNCSSSEAFQ